MCFPAWPQVRYIFTAVPLSEGVKADGTGAADEAEDLLQALNSGSPAPGHDDEASASIVAALQRVSQEQTSEIDVICRFYSPMASCQPRKFRSPPSSVVSNPGVRIARLAMMYLPSLV